MVLKLINDIFIDTNINKVLLSLSTVFKESTAHQPIYILLYIVISATPAIIPICLATSLPICCYEAQTIDKWKMISR